MRPSQFIAPLLLSMSTLLLAADFEPPKFEAQTIDDKVAIGYATAIADVDGDGKPDIVLVDKKQYAWFHNPDWKKHIICENVTKQDNVCIAARDIDGDGKAEIAIGAEWNPGDTVNSGSVHYLIPPADRTQKWEVVNLHHEPTVHRMKWVQGADKKFMLVVAPLHGRGNKNAEGDGVKFLAYHMPANPKDEWKTEVLEDTLHITHNFDVVNWSDAPGEEIILGGKENIFLIERGGHGWNKTALISAGEQGFKGCGEVRLGKLPGGGKFIATVEPFHGDKVCTYTAPAAGEKFWKRVEIDGAIKEGHAVGCADFAGVGYDQVALGWRTPNGAKKVGINLYVPPAQPGGDWKKFPIDEDKMACEDLAVGDLNGDGRPDIVASGRATKNLVIYWNKK